MLNLTDKNKNMQYKVPQDVQREDTIVGPITLKQLIILAVGGGLAYAIYIQLSAIYFAQIWLPPVLIISAITLAIAFLKVHDLPFYEFLMNLIEYNLLGRKRIWIQGSGKPFIPPYEKEKKEEKSKKEIKKKEPKNISELSAVLDSHGEIKNNKEKNGTS